MYIVHCTLYIVHCTLYTCNCVRVLDRRVDFNHRSRVRSSGWLIRACGFLQSGAYCSLPIIFFNIFSYIDILCVCSTSIFFNILSSGAMQSTIWYVESLRLICKCAILFKISCDTYRGEDGEGVKRWVSPHLTTPLLLLFFDYLWL